MKKPIFTLTVRSRSGRILDPLANQPVTHGAAYGRRALRERLAAAKGDPDLDVSVRRDPRMRGLREWFSDGRPVTGLIRPGRINPATGRPHRDDKQMYPPRGRLVASRAARGRPDRAAIERHLATAWERGPDAYRSGPAPSRPRTRRIPPEAAFLIGPAEKLTPEPEGREPVRPARRRAR